MWVEGQLLLLQELNFLQFLLELLVLELALLMHALWREPTSRLVQLVPSRSKSQGEVFPVLSEAGRLYLNTKVQSQREKP